MKKQINTEPIVGTHSCDRCDQPATVAQWWHRGKPEDRIGPKVTLRCEEHKK